jgi:hypothetical protein
MTKPDDIPQDVWDKADHLETVIDCPDYVPRHTVLIARAIMAEREACAQVATDFSDRIGASHFVAVQVAAAIRNRGAA